MASPLHIRKMSVFLNDVIQVLSQINPYLRYHCLYLSAVLKSLSRVRLLVTSWTVACQAPLSMGFSRQEYWSRLPFPPPVGLPNPGIEPRPPALQVDSLPTEPPGIINYFQMVGTLSPREVNCLAQAHQWWNQDLATGPLISMLLIFPLHHFYLLLKRKRKQWSF